MDSQQIQNKLIVLTNQIQQMSDELLVLKNDVKTRLKLSDQSRAMDDLNIKIKANSEDINKINQRLSTIKLPEDTRFYLGVDEIEAYRSTVAQLLAMMNDFKSLYNNLVAYNSTRRWKKGQAPLFV